MDTEYPYKIAVHFPGNLEYIPSIRKLVYDILQVAGFSNKFAFRSEIIVDEICNNAVRFGCDKSSDIELGFEIDDDRIEFTIRDGGGNPLHIKRLKKALQQQKKEKKSSNEDLQSGLGLNLVKMLSQEVDFSIDDNNVTSVHVVRKREDNSRICNGSNTK